MKVTDTLQVAIAFIAVAFVAAACAPHGMRPEPNVKNYVVELKPKVGGSKNELKVRTQAQGDGKKNRKPGYVGFGENESGFIILTLKDETPGDRCPSGSNGGNADWVITLVELSASGDPETEKGRDFGGPHPDWLKKAFPDVNLKSGIVYTATRSDAAASVVIDNDNDQEGAQNIYYRVTAEPCGGGEPAVTDPMVRNRGK